MAKQKHSKTKITLRKPRAAKIVVRELTSVLNRWHNNAEWVEEQIKEVLSSLLEDEDSGIELSEDSSLSDVIGELVGLDSELYSRVVEFEDMVNGYMGDIEWDDLADASLILDGVVSQLDGVVRAYEAQQPNLF